MRVLILGAGGMLGHVLLRTLLERGHETFGTLRGDASPYAGKAVILYGVDAMNFDRVAMSIDAVRPDAVVNCIGVIKQRAQAKDAVPSITLNALLPHRLAELGVRLIHFSTDCVFDGQEGPYELEDPTNATDLYGRTKALGEVDAPNALTLRTSIIGRELTQYASLVEWFLAQEGTVQGFTRALYSGMTTATMASLVCRILENHPELHGIYQATSEPISKYDLLLLMREAFDKKIEIVADDTFFCDRRMNGSLFEEAIGWKAPAWSEQIAKLAEEGTRDPAWPLNPTK